MHKLITGALAAGLLFAATACGSDATTATTTAGTTPAAVTEPASTDAAADTTGATTAGTAAADTTAAPVTPIAGLSDAQSQVVTMTLDAAAAVGVEIDETCFIAVAAQLSEADAQLIIAAGSQGSPTLSAEGEALGAEAQKCVTADPSVTPTT